MTDKLSKSPDRGTFQAQKYLERKAEEGLTPENDETVRAMMDFFDRFANSRDQYEQDPAWRENNLEYDLRSSSLIIEKCRSSKSYSQNLYAALCNTEWQKLDVMPILKDQFWSCSWRYAGGIVADILGEGDYIDWYCSGIAGGDEPDVYNEGSDLKSRGYVGEGVVTDEIRADLRTLAWQQANEDSDE